MKFCMLSKSPTYYEKHQEIEHPIEEGNEECLIKVTDMVRHMYTAYAPDPDFFIRTSGETRLSNFLLWQTTYCHLYSPRVLWTAMSFWHLIWAILNYQRAHPYLVKKRKKGT
ncbi:hypothetical protein Scep_000118 [Stephania cephalantha]|uniref:Dehydrodolichyl diphosphate synthase n=1 Tax=Stephania cephalantha TaxID=152367 RepID=A0AAP0L6Y8_9MAGN